VVHPASRIAPPGWVGVVALGNAAIATAPDAVTPAAVETIVGGVSPETATECDWSATGAVEVLGPASLFFAHGTVALPDRPIVTARQDSEALAAFVARLADKDASEAALERISSPVFVVMHGSQVVAACGYQRWVGQLAHMSVAVDAVHRGSGLGRAVASAAIADAVGAGLLPQWRARPRASQQLATSLGLVRLGSQVAVRFDHA
jgi:GNAT superfamily N-acetyltransferase